MKFLELLEKHDWKITIPLLLILLAGIVTLYSTGLSDQTGFLGGDKDLSNQISFIVLGLGFYIGILLFDYYYLKFLPVQLVIVLSTILSLVGVLFLGVTRNNAKRWFDLGFATIQPSEFAKVALIIILAFILTQIKRLPESTRAVVAIIFTTLVAALIFIEPNLSTALIVLAMGAITFLSFTKAQVFWLFSFVNLTIYLLIFTGQAYLNLIPGLFIDIGVVKIDFLLLGLVILANFLIAVIYSKYRVFAVTSFVATLLIIAVASFSWNFVLRPYQRNRIVEFVNPADNSGDQGFQVDQAKVAIGSGKLFGKGFGQGTQSKLKFLPEQHTDFIFAAYAEEFGWAGAVVLLILYLVLIISVLQVAIHTKDEFGYILCIGVAAMFLLEVFINIGVNIELIPATGVALPLMSLGGSSMWAKLIALGLVQSVSIKSKSGRS